MRKGHRNTYPLDFLLAWSWIVGYVNFLNAKKDIFRPHVNHPQKNIVAMVTQFPQIGCCVFASTNPQVGFEKNLKERWRPRYFRAIHNYPTK